MVTKVELSGRYIILHPVMPSILELLFVPLIQKVRQLILVEITILLFLLRRQVIQVIQV